MKRMFVLLSFIVIATTPAILNSANDPGARFRGGSYDGHSSWFLFGAKLPAPGTMIMIR